jgi:predicted metal-dependent peptidase
MASRQHKENQKHHAVVQKGFNAVAEHPLFAAFRLGYGYHRCLVTEETRHHPYPTREHRMVVDCMGAVYARPGGGWTQQDWQYATALCFLHLGLGHSVMTGAWTLARHVAAHLEAHRFLTGMKLAPVPDRFVLALDGVPDKSAAELETWLVANVEPTRLARWLPYPDRSFFVPAGEQSTRSHIAGQLPDFIDLFGRGVRNALELAIDVAVGRRASITEKNASDKPATQGQKARAWLLAHYPLLSGIAAYFTLVESLDECRAQTVRVAMIDVLAKKVYLNPLAGLNQDECVYVLAHEYLHAGLNHFARLDGRDPEIWNVACDFAINGWLEELRIGKRPGIGAMFDEQFKGWSAERIYDFLVRNIRILRKWETLAGPGKRDFIGASESSDTDAERYCREALCQGYFRHQSLNRGLLPAELTESIRALEQPAIPWDVQLGRWFDLHVPFPERRRSYLRPSRRQSASPDTPLPRTVVTQEYKSNAHTFGVVLDTSGSMTRNLLAKALGAVAQYALAHEVPAVRMVFCDARPYDAGYVRPDDLLYQPVMVQGRGGTKLAPAVEFLENQDNFPATAPILILTDGETDVFQIKRTHAFVLPKGKRLPFAAGGEVFYIK